MGARLDAELGGSDRGPTQKSLELGELDPELAERDRRQRRRTDRFVELFDARGPPRNSGFRGFTLAQLFVERQGHQPLQKRVEAGEGDRGDDQHHQDTARVCVEGHRAGDERDDDQPIARAEAPVTRGSTETRRRKSRAARMNDRSKVMLPKKYNGITISQCKLLTESFSSSSATRLH
jgi:hypothetical protein